MKLSELVAKMSEFNQKVSRGAGCDAWRDFVKFCEDYHGTHPDNINCSNDLDMSGQYLRDWYTAWLTVIDGTSPIYQHGNGNFYPFRVVRTVWNEDSPRTLSYVDAGFMDESDAFAYILMNCEEDDCCSYEVKTSEGKPVYRPHNQSDEIPF